jgi:methylamine dehydrogenase heavy chain
MCKNTKSHTISNHLVLTLMKNSALYCLIGVLIFGLNQHSVAEVPIDKIGVVEKVSSKPTAHWLWVYDPNFISFSDGRAHLIDGDSGYYIGTLNTGYVHAKLTLPSHNREIYSAETYYSRHVGGTRTDLVRIYDPINLSLIDEIKIPNKRATTIPRLTNTGLTDNNRFMAVFNLTPATSVSIVDLKIRKFVDEIVLPGCALSIPAKGMRFLSLCSNGAAFTFTLDDKGKLLNKQRSEPFFNVEKDPILENAVRYKDSLLFPSVEGMLYTIDISKGKLGFPVPWSLVNDEDRAEGWRTGGMQQIAVNESHALLYSIMHQGTSDTYEHPGPEIWVYDLEKKQRIKRIKTERISVSIHVSPDAKPLLFSLPDNEATLDIYDGLTGAHLRTVTELGVTPFLMETPPYKMADL